MMIVVVVGARSGITVIGGGRIRSSESSITIYMSHSMIFSQRREIDIHPS